MKEIIKKISKYIPKRIYFGLYKIYESYFSMVSSLATPYRNMSFRASKSGPKYNILFYHPSGLSFGGTEKALQIIAKHINKDKYDVFFMYSSKPRYGSLVSMIGRKPYLDNQNIKMIDFSYRSMSMKYPFIIKDMNPSIFDVIADNSINLIFTAGTGYSEFPINLIRKIPIIMINIFGRPSTQKNIKKHLCISKEVEGKISDIVPKNKSEVMYIQSEEPMINTENLRVKLGFSEDDFIFGRIGRADDSIFDQIGIEAFKIVLQKYSTAHYLIMSPAPILVETVNKQKIKNVHFLPASAEEKDIWSFHKSIDCLAHFRIDGESCGLNIAEAMLCGKPVVSHRSKIWNAHTEYLDDTFSRVAGVDNVEQYANFMIEMIEAKKTEKIIEMGVKAKEKAQNLFLIKNNITKIEEIIKSCLI